VKNIFGIVGWSGSGKTHLICRIIKYFDKKKDINDYELFSLKITDSLYKKDIGKFLETLSSHFI